MAGLRRVKRCAMLKTAPRYALLSLLMAACSAAPATTPVQKTPASTASVMASQNAAPVRPAPLPVDPTAAARRDVLDTYFGREIVDPYRWMETDSPDYVAWMKAQSERTRKTIDAIAERATLGTRIAELDNAGNRVNGVQLRGGKVFSLEAEPGRDDFRIFARDALGATKRLLLSPGSFAEGGAHVSIDYYVASPDGRFLLVGLSKAGSESSVIHVIETATGKERVGDTIDRARYARASWLDDKSFFYKRDRNLPEGTPATERFIKARVHLHELGKDPEKDVQVFGYGLAPDINIPEDAFPAVSAPQGSAYVFADLEHGVQPTMSLYYVARKDLKGAKTPWKKLCEPKDGITDYNVHEDELYLTTQKDSPRSRIIKTSLKKPDLLTAKEVVPQTEEILRWATTDKEALYVSKLDAGVGKLYRMPFKTGKIELIELGQEGSVRSMSTDSRAAGALIRIDAWTHSPSLVVFDPKKKTIKATDILPASSVVFEGIVATSIKSKSADGTLVPLTLIHKKDLPKDGNNPVYLNGYGAYGWVWEPSFEPMNLAWLERGGIYAVCHVRGGGEYGETWASAGKLATKPNTINDFIGCAQTLVDEKWSTPKHIAGQGTSAGGIMIGGAIVRRPDLFGAAVIRVGMVNALRFEQIPIGPFNIGEFGTVATKEGFNMLYEIDAYHHVEKGKAYPAVMLTTGITDPRVSPWQMAKMAARLGDASSSGKPVLLRVDYDAGHGLGSTKSQRENELADIFAFLFSQIGR